MGNDVEEIASRIAIALGNEPTVVFQLEPVGDGTFRPILDPETVKAIVTAELTRVSS